MKSIIGLILSAAAGAAIGFIIGKRTADEEFTFCHCKCGGECECPDFVEPTETEEDAVDDAVDDTKENLENVVLDDIDDIKEDK